MGSVSGNVERIAHEYQQHLPFTVDGMEALRRYGDRGPRNARRLHDLVQYRITDLKVDPVGIAQDLATHELNHCLQNGELL